MPDPACNRPCRAFVRRVALLAALCAIVGGVLWHAAFLNGAAETITTGDAPRDAVLSAFDQTVFDPGFGQGRVVVGSPVHLEFHPAAWAFPQSVALVAEDVALATGGRVSTEQISVGQIIVSKAADLPVPCRIRKDVRLGGVLGSEIEISGATSDDAAGRCFTTALLAVLGVSQAPRGGELNTRDRVLLHLIYGASLSPGMSRSETLAAVRREVDSMSRDMLCAPPGGFC